ncbi:MAG: enoyl-CoA hydratase-related protein [Solirubrobacterales bacterium]|nr:enoyl-CoA hydratase-related protein [Solirubrobacterales bacterium]
MTGHLPELPDTIRLDSPADGVWLLTIDRATRMNAIGPVEAGGLFAATAAFREDPEAAVMVITGAGQNAFCAGADLKSVAAMFTEGSAEEPLFDPADPDGDPIPVEGNIGPTRWTSVHKPMIAAVNGAAYAGGLEWACFAHLRIADQHASFGVTCRRWNVGLGDGGTQRLPRLIGLSRALDLIITGRVIGASEAERIGLVNEVTTSGSCVARAVELATEIAALPQPALRTDLEAAVRGFGRPLDEGLEVERECFNRLLTEPQIRQGVRRFVDRDHPDRVSGAAPLHLPAKAYAFAVRAHEGQPGKYGRGRFMEHPARVARTTASFGGDEIAVAAAYLHDTLEHSDVTPEEVGAAFGPDLRELVLTLSNDSAISDLDDSRADHRRRIATAGRTAQLVWLADRLDGIGVLTELIEAGEEPGPLDADRRFTRWQDDLELAAGFDLPSELKAETADRLHRLGQTLAG